MSTCPIKIADKADFTSTFNFMKTKLKTLPKARSNYLFEKDDEITPPL